MNTLKNPQLIFDVRVSDNVDAVLAVIAQTFMDSCTVSEHKVGRVRAEEGRPGGEGSHRGSALSPGWGWLPTGHGARRGHLPAHAHPARSRIPQ